MSGNRYLLADKSKLLRKKLEMLTSNLTGKLGNSSLQTYEQYTREVIRVLGEFYKSLKEPQLDKELIETIRKDDLPDSVRYNKIWQQIIDDLTIVFTELENIEDLTLANFNFITTESNRLSTKLKAVDSKLGDYILFSLSPSKDLQFFTDSFNDLSKIDVNSSLLNSPECRVNQTEGIITLPLTQGVESLIVVKELPIINPNSNGSVGNNQELGVSYNGNIGVLLDNNPDTWFEYERVVQKNLDDKDPLILDITMNLGSEQVINFIRINPNNFGTRTTTQIDVIETSIDGQVYVNIKDDIPIAGFTTQDEENIFSLAPSTSKFAGQGLYTFTPRKARYIHLIFRQTEPYIINTSAGERLRYAIGLRDINVRGWGYDNKGEIVSTAFESLREIKKVVLETNQNPTSLSELASINYYISPDNGGTWHQIQPKGFYGPTGVNAVPEVINFNTGDTNEVVTSVPVKSIRLKTTMKREDDQFEEGSSTFRKRVVNTSELYEVPQGSPFQIELRRPPVDGTIVIVDPLFGSRGIQEAQYVVGHAVDGLDVSKYRLPFKNLKRPMQKASDGTDPNGVTIWHTEPVPASEWIHTEVGGEEWEQVSQPLSSYSMDFTDIGSYKKYYLNPNTGVLEFGDGLTTTLTPGERQPISVYFNAERLFPSETEDIHLALLDFATSNNKDDMTIEFYDEITDHVEIIPRKATVIRLDNKFIEEEMGIGLALSGVDNFNLLPENFVDGNKELQGDTNSWSIDKDEGIVYTARPTTAVSDISVSYTYQPITELTVNDWEWGTSDILRDSISIKESAWKTISVVDESLPTTSGIQVLDLSKLSIVKGTLRFEVQGDGSVISTSDDEHPFVREVDYINGIEELGSQFKKTTEHIPNDLTPTANVATFTLAENISSRTSEHPVSFTNTTLFSTNVSPSTPARSGEYSVNRTPGAGYRQVKFYTTTTQTAPGKITYFYASSNYSDIGLYSVDYELGRIYTQRAVFDSGSAYSTWSIYASYEYTDYRAKYRIARLMDTNSYSVDVTNNRITFKDSEILKHLQVPHSSMNSRSPLYLINYDYVDETREDAAALAPKFSPVLKDYSIRILTKGKIV